MKPKKFLKEQKTIMKNHPLYEKLKQIALDGDYTIEQVENATYDQITKLIDKRVPLAFLTNMKRLLVAEIREAQDETDLQGLKQTAKNWLDTNFPAWQVERGREGGNPFVKIWLKGKPE